ncbi:MAG: type II toxin-antitoxin system VapB family antitoxin [Pseudomonadota bacterium]
MKRAKIFTNGRNQAVRLPRQFEFEGIDEVFVRKEGASIILTPVRKNWVSFAEFPKGDADFMSDRPELMDEDRVVF